jgi:hypothetical protein
VLDSVFEKEEASLKEAVNEALAYCDEEERSHREALLNRALHPQCDFDRGHRLMLYALALVPEQVSWGFKMRERLHRFFRGG